VANTNCLSGIACPKCKSEGPFCIACDVVMLITDDGCAEQVGDNCWDDESYIECRECLHHGKVSDFQTEETA
jgi:hypothetical protein